MTGPQHGWSQVARLLAVATSALLVLLWATTSPTLSAWTAGVVTNSTDTAAVPYVAFTHSTGACSLGPRVSGASASCTGSLAPAVASSPSPVTRTDTLTNNGTILAGQLGQGVSGASCAAVQLSNLKRTNPLLPRYNTGFQTGDPWGGTNAINLDGASYADAVLTYTMASVDNASYGLGVWFKASSGQSGPLFETGSSAVNTAGTDDRILYLNPNGTLTFLQNIYGNTTTTTAGYADGNWHFAYVTLTDEGTTTNTRLQIDLGTPKTNGSVSAPYSTGSGYIHVGWAPTAKTGLTTAYFTGKVSNLVVFNGGTAPAAPTSAQLTSQSSFTGWASGSASLTDHWPMSDAGTTTYAGTQPTIGTTSPCTYLSISWTFTSPSATAVSSMLLSAFATGNMYSVSASPGPAGTQTGAISIARAGNYNSYVAGLRLYVPFTHRIATSSGQWQLTFTWSSSASVVIA